jgi:HPt (histidine-containing phosphotransfer) domain-containing protein
VPGRGSTMKDNNDSFEQQLGLLRDAYARDLVARLAVLEDLWARLQRDGWERTVAQDLRQRVHRMRGSGATFGFPQLSEAARHLEDALRKADVGNAGPTPQQLADIGAELGALRQALGESASNNREAGPRESNSPSADRTVP